MQGILLEHAHAYRDVIREIRTEKLVNKGFPDIDFFSKAVLKIKRIRQGMY
jgi:hypothetical protein